MPVLPSSKWLLYLSHKKIYGEKEHELDGKSETCKLVFPVEVAAKILAHSFKTPRLSWPVSKFTDGFSLHIC